MKLSVDEALPEAFEDHPLKAGESFIANWRESTKERASSATDVHLTRLGARSHEGSHATPGSKCRASRWVPVDLPLGDVFAVGPG